MKNLKNTGMLAAVLLSLLCVGANAQDKAVQWYNSIGFEAATARWTGKDVNVSTFRVAPGMLLGGHWILFLPVDLNIDMYNTQSTGNFQTQFLLGPGAGYAKECRNGCFWDAAYSWSTTLLNREMNYQQHQIRFRLGAHTVKGDLFCQAGVILRRDWQTAESHWMPTVGLGIRL